MTARSIVSHVAQAPMAAVCFVIGLTVLAGFSVTEAILHATGNQDG